MDGEPPLPGWAPDLRRLSQALVQLALRPTGEAIHVVEKNAEPREVRVSEKMRYDDVTADAMAEQRLWQQGPSSFFAPA
jgi:hypothetical protein